MFCRLDKEFLLNNDIRDQISKYIKETETVYEASPDRITSEYKSEKETKKDYKGRELFELLQNADDASAKNVSFDLDSQKSLLTISNTGHPFSLSGYKSILLQNNSSKNSEQYIGNKGKGFRSILTWADKIIIRSNGLDLIFSEEIAQDSLQRIQFKNKLKEDILAATLAFPEIKNNIDIEKKWATQIIIKYKIEYLSDINKQLQDLFSTKCLLEFLNNIEELNVNDVKILKNTKNYDVLTPIKESFPTDCNFIEENDIYKKYEIKGILSKTEDLSSEPLYSFLPTKIHLNLPILLHVTFELNSARNDITNSKKNEFIFNKVIEYIKYNVILYTQKECSWTPYSILNYSYRDVNIENTFSFYTKIDKLKCNLKIIPCIDGKYRNINDVIFLDNKTSEYLEKLQNKHGVELPNEFWCIAKSKPEAVKSTVYNKLNISAFSKLSKILVGIQNEFEIRAQLIYYFNKELHTLLPINWENSDENTLFIDENHAVIKYNQRIFTHKTKHDLKNLPYFVNVTFLHTKLLTILLNKFECNDDDKYRQIQRILKEIAQITAYEPIPLIELIISDTQKVIKKEEKYSVSNVKKMMRAIYGIWTEDTGSLKVKAPIISSEMKVLSNTDNVFFNSSYSDSKESEFIWKDYIEQNSNMHFVLNKPDWDFTFENCKFECFLEWLGVKRTLPVAEFKENFSLISQQLNLTQLLLYCIKNQGAISDFEIKNMINQKFHIDNYVIDCKDMAFINIDFDIDKKLLQESFNIENYYIDNILLNLDAKQNLEELSCETLEEIISKKLPIYKEDGSCAQSLYMHLIKNNNKIKELGNKENYKIKKCRLYSKNKKEYLWNKDMYYYDNRTIPMNIIEKYPIIDLPRRIGETQVSEIFGINTFKNITLTDIKGIPQKKITKEFNTYFSSMIPLFLAYRAIKSENFEKIIDEQSELINNVEIRLCTDITYKIDIIPQKMQDFEFINDKINKINSKKESSIYYLKIPTSIESLKDLNDIYRIRMGEFISEVLAITFRLSDGERYSAIYKDGDINYSEGVFTENYPSKILEYAKRKNNLTPKECFWKKIYELKNLKKEVDFNKWYLKISDNGHWEFDYETYDGDDGLMNDCLYTNEINDIESFFRGLDSVNFSSYNIEIYKNKYEKLYIEKFYPIIWAKCINHKKDFEDKITQCNWSKVARDFMSIIPINKFEKNHAEKIWNYVSTLGLGIKKDASISKTYAEIKIILDANIEKYSDYLDEIKSKSEIYSLLSFEDTTELDNWCETIKQKNAQQLAQDDQIDDLPDLTKVNNFNIPNFFPSKQKGSHHSRSIDLQKGSIGARNEKRAEKELKTIYKTVEKAKNDSMGYDFICFDENEEVHYYEVKTLSKGGFNMSSNEYETYCNHNELTTSYHLFLIHDDYYKIIDNIDKECVKIPENYFIKLI